MLKTHEPHDEFIDRLAGQLRVEIRRRNRSRPVTAWTRWVFESPVKASVAAALLIVVSMGAGAIAVAGAYQAQGNEERNVLVANYAQRAQLARQRLSLASEQLRTAEQRMSMGIGSEEDRLEARLKVTEAQAALKVIELQLAEIQASGREPLNAVSSPLVSGRDFVSERWRTESSMPVAGLELEKARLQTLQRRFAVGAATNADVSASRARIGELEAALIGIQKRIDIRQRFLRREMDGPMAELRALETEAELRRQTLAPRIELARGVVKDTQMKVDIGTAQRFDLAQAQLRLRELELEMSRAEVDLAVIRRQLDQLRGR